MNFDNIRHLLDEGLSNREIGRRLAAANLTTSEDTGRHFVAAFRKLDNGKSTPLGYSMEQDFGKGSASEVYTRDNPPTNYDDALKGSQADLSIWKPIKYKWNWYAGNYQVKIEFVRREVEPEQRLTDFLADLKNELDQFKVTTVPGSGTAVVALADFHFGMKFDGDAKNPPFNAETLVERIKQLVAKINAMGYEKVHLALLGDFIESFTGLNHMDTWKHLESYGRTAVMGVCGIIRDHLILGLNNVEKVYIVAGNHDRISKKKDEDSRGEAAGLIADVLELMVDVPIEFDYSCLNPKIDGRKYIFAHGDLGLSKRDEYALILEYGDPSCYNVIVQGHDHRRFVKKGRAIRKDYVTQTVSLEGSNFRKVIVPPLVSGGAFSSSLGLFGQTGATVLYANQSGVDHWDLG